MYYWKVGALYENCKRAAIFHISRTRAIFLLRTNKPRGNSKFRRNRAETGFPFVALERESIRTNMIWIWSVFLPFPSCNSKRTHEGKWRPREGGLVSRNKQARGRLVKTLATFSPVFYHRNYREPRIPTLQLEILPYVARCIQP